ncbi:MAG TPA: cytochrome c [Bryobacteraceae bacterium]|nr:cytochrome c [Bryobacteraceae bacterium]
MKVPKTILWILLAAVVVGLGYGLVLMRHGISARKDPSTAEIRVARTLRHLAIPRLDRTDENPWKDVATPDVMKDAREHFADHCAQCHANDGSGNTEMGKNLYPRAPDMRLPATQDLSDGELYYIIRNGVPLTGMPAWGEPHLDQDDESWQLVLFIRHLSHLTPEEIKDMESYNPKGKMEEEEEPAESPGAATAPVKPAEEHHHH